MGELDPTSPWFRCLVLSLSLSNMSALSYFIYQICFSQLRDIAEPHTFNIYNDNIIHYWSFAYVNLHDEMIRDKIVMATTDFLLAEELQLDPELLLSKAVI